VPSDRSVFLSNFALSVVRLSPEWQLSGNTNDGSGSIAARPYAGQRLLFASLPLLEMKRQQHKSTLQTHCRNFHHSPA
jgi:hypothetical protein